MQVRILASFSLFLAIFSLALFLHTIFLKIGKRENRPVSLLTFGSIGMNQAFTDWVIYEEKSIFEPLFRFLPPVVFWLIFGVLFYGEVVFYFRIRRKSRNILTALSIKESLDNLPEGVCFAESDGTPLLVNRRMNMLSEELFGHQIPNTNDCDKRLQTKKVQDGVEIINLEPDFLVKINEDVWSIHYHLHGGIREVVASNVRHEYQLTREIEERNRRLTAVNRRLKEYSDNVDAYIKEKEILAAKIKVHDDIGRSLISLRSYLQNECCRPSERESLVEMWRRCIRLMRGEEEETSPEDNLRRNFFLAAAGVKVHVPMKGQFPQEKHIAKTVLDILHECLNNTVRHAEGSEMPVTIAGDKHRYLISVRNNGKQPEEEIKETGGLGNIRERVEMEGGTMRIQSFPHFLLQIELPKGAENEKDESDDC